MSKIDSDKVLRQALHALVPEQQRLLGTRLVKNVLPLTDDERVQRIIETAEKADVSDDELAEAYKLGRMAVVESRTRCGADCNWEDQAAHFVARAATAVVAPPGKCKAPDPPWQAVMSCRMARDCAILAADDGSENTEAEAQYDIAENFLNTPNSAAGDNHE